MVRASNLQKNRGIRLIMMLFASHWRWVRWNAFCFCFPFSKKPRGGVVFMATPIKQAGIGRLPTPLLLLHSTTLN